MSSERALATVRRVGKIEPIDGADFIELAHIDGWQCVIKKGVLQPGDLCMYFEIDSILPEAEWSEFMRDRKFRVKTIKLRGCLSQGLALPLKDVGAENGALGEDYTKVLGVKKHDPEAEKEARENANRKKVYPWWTRLPFGMRVYRWFHPKRGSWPHSLPKTDETRVQNIRNLDSMINGRLLYITEKLDGQSLTYYVDQTYSPTPFKKGCSGVCSRNVHYPEYRPNNWWDYVQENGLMESLERFCKSEGRSLAIQGELVGPGIQGNKLLLKERQLYIFNIYDLDKRCYLPLFEKLEIVDTLGLTHVPFLCFDEFLPTTEGFLLIAGGPSIVNADVLREGIVVRDKNDDGMSFKAISNEWLLKHKE